MNFDRNTIIGFVVLALLFLGFFYYNNKQQLAYQKEKAHQDSLLLAGKPKQDVKTVKMDSVAVDSFHKQTIGGDFLQALNGSEQITTVDNDLFKIAFTNKGGQPKWVELKKFRNADSSNVRLNTSDFDKIDYIISTGDKKTADVSNFYFLPSNVTTNPDGSKSISFQLAAQGRSIVHEYVIRSADYMLDFNIRISGADQLLSNNVLNLTWQNKPLQLQKDLGYEKQQARVSYMVNNEFDQSSVLKDGSEEFTKPVYWVSVKQQFFNTTLIAKNNFTGGSMNWVVPGPADPKTVIQSTANLRMQLPNSTSAVIPLSLYYGPTDYKILKKYGNDMEAMVNLGSGIFAFVKYINKWIVIPMFDLFSKLTSNFGIVILLLTLFIRLLISPLTYSSYLSGAKMKVLKPEIDKLKAKHGGDQQAMSVEQMKLFREAGVNPLGGCIPALFQIPIFFALYNFFSSNVALRGQSFLWAHDLSQYDSVWDFGFNIPLLGDHLSLFTITAVATSFLISLYSMSMTPDQGNPVLKYMPYFFPIILLFVFNKLPAGLTWYYTVSNAITLALQFVIQTYIIDHDKILAKIEVNRKKPKTKSKWQQRMDQIQEQQRQLKASQNKNRN